MSDEEREKLKKRFIEEFQEVPITSLVCKKVGVPRATFYRWKNEDNVFSEACSESKTMGIDSLNDLAESSLINEVKKGNMAAIKYWLDVNHSKYKNAKHENVDSIRHERIKELDKEAEKLRIMIESWQKRKHNRSDEKYIDLRTHTPQEIGGYLDRDEEIPVSV